MLNQKLLSGTGGAPATYVEDVFSTYLYTGNSSTQTITNGIDLAGKGGMTWIKGRSGVTDHALYDTTRGATFDLASNLVTAQTTQSTGLTSFSSTGFSIGALAKLNSNTATYASWTFRKQPKFFDVVTYTGTGANRTISHSLGSVPGMIIVKRTDTTADWQVYHSSLANTQYLVLNTTATSATGATRWNSTTPTSSVFSLGTDATVNASGGTYVAYIYASNAGGFGLSGTDNVISCGSYTGNGSATGPVINLGYEPQYVMVKCSSALGNWVVEDIMRGMSQTSYSSLAPNTSGVESGFALQIPSIIPTATGFKLSLTDPTFNAIGQTYIYMAIRRPMKVPTDATKVFSSITRTGGGFTQTISTTSFVDLVISGNRTNPGSTSLAQCTFDRLRGPLQGIYTTLTNADEAKGGTLLNFDISNGYSVGADTNELGINMAGTAYVNWIFARRPGFFDAVCYTGTGANATQTHNLGKAPELMIIKSRSSAQNWQVYSSSLANTEYLSLNLISAKATGATRWNSTTPTSSVFSIGTDVTVNASAGTYVAYLFATCPGVSKVGSYTGTGATQTINCGFTGGARFVLIKRTDSTGDWYVWDTARGIVSDNDPYLLLNKAAAEVTSTDYIDPVSSGFEISSTAPAAINASGGSFIFFAVA